MGLSFYYSGRLEKEASVTDLIDEVKDIAEILNWKYQIFDTDFPEVELTNGKVDGNLYGICFAPENCEPVFLCFLSNRHLCSPVNLDEFLQPVEKVEEDAYLIFTKTQYAGPDAHMAVMHVIKHISNKYLEDFKLSDEGQYWETGDEDLLRKTFKRYSALIDSFATALETFSKETGESFEQYFARLLTHLDKNRNEDGG